MKAPGADAVAMPAPRFVARGAFRIAYSTFGDHDATPLVICHGLAAEGAQFRADAEWFAGQGYFVLVPDLRGHGRSTSPPDRKDADYAIAEMAADLVLMLDAESVATTHWVGNSLGGILAYHIIETAPERLRSLVTFGTAQRLSVPAFLPLISNLAQKLVGPGLTAMVTARMTSRQRETRLIIEAILQRMDRDAVMRVTRNLLEYDLRPAARSFPRPMLMLRGSLDRAVNAALGPTLANMEGLPNFRLVEIDGAGHCANLDRPERVRAEILSFLTALD